MFDLEMFRRDYRSDYARGVDQAQLDACQAHSAQWAMNRARKMHDQKYMRSAAYWAGYATATREAVRVAPMR